MLTQLRRGAVVIAVAMITGVLISSSGSHGDGELPELQPGKPPETAKDFTLADVHGLRVQLAKIEAPVIILHFWTKYRGNCAYDLALLQKLHDKYRDRDVKIIGLAYNSGTREDLIERSAHGLRRVDVSDHVSARPGQESALLDVRHPRRKALGPIDCGVARGVGNAELTTDER